MNITAPYKFTLYGSKERVATDSKSECTLSAITALSDIVSIDLYSYSYNRLPIIETNERSGDSQLVVENSIIRTSFEFRLNEYAVATDEQNIDDLTSVLIKRNKYILPVITPYNKLICTAGSAIAVVISGLDEQIENGVKNITIQAKKRKPISS